MVTDFIKKTFINVLFFLSFYGVFLTIETMEIVKTSDVITVNEIIVAYSSSISNALRLVLVKIFIEIIHSFLVDKLASKNESK